MEFITSNLAPIMFAGLIVFLLMGFPVAFSLGACGLFFGFIGIELGMLPEALLQALPLRIYGIMQNDQGARAALLDRPRGRCCRGRLQPTAGAQHLQVHAALCARYAKLQGSEQAGWVRCRRC